MLRLFATPKTTPVFPAKSCCVISRKRYAHFEHRKILPGPSVVEGVRFRRRLIKETQRILWLRAQRDVLPNNEAQLGEAAYWESRLPNHGSIYSVLPRDSGLVDTICANAKEPDA